MIDNAIAISPKAIDFFVTVGVITVSSSLFLFLVAYIFSEGGTVTSRQRKSIFIASFAIGFSVAYIASGVRERGQKAEALLQKIFAEMPADWRQMYDLLDATTDSELAGAYLEEFLKTKTEPELTPAAYNQFITVIKTGVKGAERLKRIADVKKFRIVDYKDAINRLEEN